MVLTHKAYDEYHEQMLKAGVSWTAHTIFASLHTGLTFLATHAVWADISSTEISSVTYPAYTAGGIAVTGPVVSSASNITKITSDAIKFSTGGTGIAAAQLVIRNKTYSGHLLMLHIDLGGTQTSSDSGNWWFTPNVSDGLARYGDTI